MHLLFLESVLIKHIKNLQNRHLLYPAVPPLGIYDKEIITRLFIIVKTAKQKFETKRFKNPLEGFQSRFDQADKGNSETEDRSFEIILL